MAKAKNGVLRLNPKFDARMLTIGSPSANTKKLHRGYFIHSATNGDGSPFGGTVRGRINFLYNPSSISVSHSVDATLAYTNETSADFSKSIGEHLGSVVGIGNVAIPLLFDRTYELWDSSQKQTLAGQLGVYADVLAFYHFLGLTGVRVNAASGVDQWLDILVGGDGTTTQIWANMYPSNPMFPTFCYAYIGNRLKYYGQITGLDVTYTHWNHQMVPMRCAVNVSMDLLVDDAAQSAIIGSQHNPPVGTGAQGGDLADLMGGGG